MKQQRLAWRIGIPFALFVFAGSMSLVLWMSWRGVDAERARLASLARSNAEFIRRAALPPSERMARQLGEVLNARVVFVRRGPVAGPVGPDDFSPSDEVLSHPKSAVAIRVMPEDGGVHTGIGFQHEAVRVPVSDAWSLALWWPRMWPWSRLSVVEALPVLAAFWVLAVIVAWLVSLGLVRPLLRLAAKLPDIEKPGALELPEASRADEIGDVARAFVGTREALRGEREQRARAEKLAVLGRMTAALAHEIQNPVAAIKMHAQLMPADDPTARTIAGEAARIEELISQWLFLGRPEPPVLAAIGLESLLGEALAAQRARMEHAGVRDEVRVEEGTVVAGDRRRLAQVFSNLIINAVQAMPRGGRLGVTVRRKGAMAAIEFEDSGAGFSEEARRRWGELFFSEKEGGMGIGLSVAGEIVRAHGGNLGVENREGGGARVTVELPLAGAAGPEAGTSVADRGVADHPSPWPGS